MKMLLDTHLLLWAASSPGELSKETRLMLEDDSNELFYSAASIWEISIKTGLGRADFSVDARVLRRNLLDNGYIELPIEGMHAAFIQSLPSLHKDPFDRILISQATVEGITLFTSDAMVAQYPGPIRFV
jgi:PIN domain nuclease of toxin-antitoxin system